MIITNKHGLPTAIVAAIDNDQYDRGQSDITVSELIQPPQAVALMRAHEADLSMDAVDGVWAIFGKAVHKVIEGVAGTIVAEERFYLDIKGWTVGGQIDRLDYDNDGVLVLEDYKCTSAWSLVLEPNGYKKEWEQQLNYYRVLVAQRYLPKRLRVVALLRDWQQSKALQNKDYPQTQVAEIHIPMWDYDKAILEMTERVEDQQRADQCLDEDGALQLAQSFRCTDEERWHQPDKWAVMKKGRKSALKVHDDLRSAKQHLESLGGEEFSIETRPGKDARCERYCAAAPFCQQHQATVRERHGQEKS